MTWSYPCSWTFTLAQWPILTQLHWLADIYMLLYPSEGSLGSTWEENKNKTHPSIEKVLWTNTRASRAQLFQEDRDPESTFSLFSSVANTRLNRDGLEQQHFHWFCVHPGFSLHFQNSRFLEQQHFHCFSVDPGFSLHSENSRFLGQWPKTELSSRSKTITYNWKPSFVWLEETLQDLPTGTHFLFCWSYQPSPTVQDVRDFLLLHPMYCIHAWAFSQGPRDGYLRRKCWMQHDLLTVIFYPGFSLPQLSN